MSSTHKTFKKLVITVFIIFFFSVLVIAYTGNAHVYFSFLNKIPGRDRTGHVFLIGFLAGILIWAFSFRSLRVFGLHVYYGALLAFVFITAEEFFQLLSTNRTFDLIDLSCNYLGIVIGSIILSRIQKNVLPTRGAEGGSGSEESPKAKR